jgi:NhaP-type Na+/H+ or K+/H+ antiporter
VIGLVVGWAISRVRRRIGDPLVEITITLFTPYAAYIPAEELGVSGVLATVAAGLYLGWRNPETTAPRIRLQAFGLWEVLPFLLNSVLFILIGSQLPNILQGISGEYSMMAVVLYVALVGLAVIGTRLLWTFPATYLPRYLSRTVRERNPSPPWQQTAAVAYTGMRGAISLAAALAIPLTVHSGAPFPARDQILFLTFCVILLTLVLQGLSLPLLVRRLGLAPERKARRSVRRPRRGCGRPRRRSPGSRNSRTRIGCARIRPPECGISTSTVASASPPVTTSNPKAVKRATATRNVPWRTSVSGESSLAPSARHSSNSGAKDASATR